MPQKEDIQDARDEIWELTKIIIRNPKPFYYASRAALLHVFKEDKKALADIAKAIKILPKEGYYYYIRAVCLERIGQDEEARDSIAEAIKLGYKPNKQTKVRFKELLRKFGF